MSIWNHTSFIYFNTHIYVDKIVELITYWCHNNKYQTYVQSVIKTKNKVLFNFLFRSIISLGQFYIVGKSCNAVSDRIFYHFQQLFVIVALIALYLKYFCKTCFAKAGNMRNTYYTYTVTFIIKPVRFQLTFFDTLHVPTCPIKDLV